MKPIPKPLRRQIHKEMMNAKCARANDGGCLGPLTVEHAYGRVRQERWQLIFLCWQHHLGPLLDKQKNKWLALKQATEEDLNKYPKSAPIWKQEKLFLEQKYGGK